MPKAIQLQIPEPCHENWNNMSPKEQGRFCGSCQKTVVDFSKMTDKEIVNYFSTASHHVCGRFSGTQLNKDLQLTEKKKRFSFAYLWNLLLAGLLVTEVSCQERTSGKVIVTDQYKRPAMLMGDTIITDSPHPAPSTDITGTVTDMITGRRVRGVTVMIQGSNTGTITDLLGSFHLSVEKKDSLTLIFSGVGYKTQTLLFNDQTKWQDVEVAMPLIGEEEIIVGGTRVEYKESKYEKVKTSINNRLPSFLKKNVKISPNPVERGVDIHINLSLKQAGNYKLELLDAKGRVVAVQPLQMTGKEQEANIPTEASWSKGIYFIRISAPRSKDVYKGKVSLQ